jgi:PKD repeat protein
MTGFEDNTDTTEAAITAAEAPSSPQPPITDVSTNPPPVVAPLGVIFINMPNVKDKIVADFDMTFDNPDIDTSKPDDGFCPLTVTFENKSKCLFLSDIASFEWDFGDTDSGDDNISDEENPAHTYDSPGIYTVTLLVKGDSGEEAKIQRGIEVHGDLTADFKAE